MHAVRQFFVRQPLLIAAVVAAATNLAVAFGLDVPGDLKAAVLVVANGLIVGTTHQLVTPVADPRLSP